MPRTARERSRSGMYHIMLRGINKQSIFEEPEDYHERAGGSSDAKDHKMQFIGGISGASEREETEAFRKDESKRPVDPADRKIDR